MKIFIISVILLIFNSCAVCEKWRSYYKENPKYGEMYFSNELSEAFFQYIEHNESLTTQNYILEEIFSRYDLDYCQECTYPGYLVTAVKFRISLSKVNEKMFKNIIDTIMVNQVFNRVTQLIDYSIGEKKNIFQIDNCYLLDYNYRNAKYLFRLNDEIYYLKITRKNNHPFLVRKLIPKEQLPERYLSIFFNNVRMNSEYGQNDYLYSFKFSGDEIFKGKRNTRIEFIDIPDDSISIHDKP